MAKTKLTVDELNAWADYWEQRIDRLLASPKVDRRTEKPARLKSLGISPEYRGKNFLGVVKTTEARNRSRPANVVGATTRQDESAVEMVAGEPEGREV